LLSFACQR
jgi:hypothetical protein